jgi:hypothetical protein
MARETIKELKAQLAKARKHEKALRADIELRDELVAVQRAKIAEFKTTVDALEVTHADWMARARELGHGITRELGHGIASDRQDATSAARDCLLECLGLERSNETLVELAIQVRDGWHEMEKGVTAGMDYVTGQDHAKAMNGAAERREIDRQKHEAHLMAVGAERDAAFRELGRLYIEQRNAERRQ